MSDSEREPLLLVNPSTDQAQEYLADSASRPNPAIQERGTLPRRLAGDERTRITDLSFGGTTCYGSELLFVDLSAVLKLL